MTQAQMGEAPADGPVRVLQIDSSISRRSGVTSVLMNYLKHMDRSKVVFDFFCFATRDETRREELEALGGRCYVIDGGKSIGRVRAGLSRVLQENEGEYPVAHLHVPALSRFLYPLVHRHQVRTFVVHSHATAYSDSRLSGVRNWLVTRNIGAYSDARLACSRAAGEFLFGRHGFKVLPNAVEVDSFRFDARAREQVRCELGIGGAPVVGHVGRFSEQKNHRFLIEVFAGVQRLRSDARLLLVGDGYLRPEIEAQITRLGLQEHVLLLGDRSDVPSLYQAMDVFLLPSLFEGLPMVGVEAQCAGLPIVCSDEVTQEVAFGESSFLPLQAPVDQWASNVVRALDAAHDLGTRAQGVVEARTAGFDIVREADRLANWYLAAARR